MFFEDVLEEYFYVCKSRNYTEKTMKNKKQEYKQLQIWLNKKQIEKLNDITTKVLQEYHTDKLKRGLKASSIVSTSKQISAFFNWCKNEDYLQENPMVKVELPKEPNLIVDTFTSDEVYKLIECFTYKSYIDARNKLIIALMADTGVRVLELTGIRDSDIYDDQILVNGKGRKERYVSISPVVRRIMIRYERLKRQYFKERLQQDDYYILNYQGAKMSNTGLWLVCKEAEKRTGIYDVHPHKFRHYFAITSLKVGKIDIHSLSQLLGHSDVSTTELYLKSFKNEDLMEVAKSSSPLMNLHKDNRKK